MENEQCKACGMQFDRKELDAFKMDNGIWLLFCRSCLERIIKRNYNNFIGWGKS